MYITSKTYGITLLAALICGCESFETERPLHVQTVWSTVQMPINQTETAVLYEKQEDAALDYVFLNRRGKSEICKTCRSPLPPLLNHVSNKGENLKVNTNFQPDEKPNNTGFPVEPPPMNHTEKLKREPIQLKMDTDFKSYRYAVLFRYGSYQIGPVGKRTIARAARESRHAEKIKLIGRVDASGDARKNEILANNRVKSVGEDLAKAGVNKKIIVSSTSLNQEPIDIKNTYWGAKMPEVDALISRRVDIVVNDEK